MKATLTQKEPQFTPTSLTLNFESQKEIDAFYALFNACLVNKIFSDKGSSGFGDRIRDAIRPATTMDRDVIFENDVIKILKVGK